MNVKMERIISGLWWAGILGIGAFAGIMLFSQNLDYAVRTTIGTFICAFFLGLFLEIPRVKNSKNKVKQIIDWNFIVTWSIGASLFLFGMMCMTAREAGLRVYYLSALNNQRIPWTTVQQKIIPQVFVGGILSFVLLLLIFIILTLWAYFLRKNPVYSASQIQKKTNLSLDILFGFSAVFGLLLLYYSLVDNKGHMLAVEAIVIVALAYFTRSKAILITCYVLLAAFLYLLIKYSIVIEGNRLLVLSLTSISVYTWMTSCWLWKTRPLLDFQWSRQSNSAFHSSSATAKLKNLEGIGGWLILLAIGIIITPIRIVALMTTYPDIFSTSVWESLTKPETQAYNPLLASIVIGEIVINSGMVLAFIYTGYLFFSKRKLFIIWYICLAVFSLIFILLDALFIKLALPDEPVFDPEMVKELMRSAIAVFVWVPYLLCSKRVKATFIKEAKKTSNSIIKLHQNPYSPIRPSGTPMHQLLQLHSTVQTASGHSCTVESFLGGGGQGEVYRAQLDGKAFALKWYFPEQATLAQRQNLEILIHKGQPSNHFLWPIELVNATNVAGFGYLMTLRDPQYKSLFDLMKCRIDPSFRALAIAGRQLANAFLELHAKGLCYRDISFGNVFFNPNTGDIQVCDNDNVTIDGTGTGGIIGTPRFIAPEVVRGEAAPSTQTDLFSLAVLLFYIFHIHHPLEGCKEAAIKCFDLPAMNKLYGTEPLFIFDPADDSNHPVPGLHDNAITYWNIYPQFLKNLFIRAFTAGIHDPHERVRESEWRATLAQLRDAILYCGHCGQENFYDGEALKAAGGQVGVCWSCHRPLMLPFRLRLGRNVVMLNHDTQLFPHHLDPQRRYDFSPPLAAVQQHPQNPTLWGLKNLSPVKWVITTADGMIRDVESGRSASLAAGVKVNFGSVEGEIRI